MIKWITDIVVEHFYTVFIVGIVVVGFLDIGVAVKKIKKALIPSCLTLVLLLGFIFAVYTRYKYAGKAELVLFLYLISAFLINFFIYIIVAIKKHKRISIIKSASYIDSPILVYLDNKGRVFYYTNEFLSMFNTKNPKQLFKKIRYIHCADQQYTFNSFLKNLSNEKEEDYNLLFELNGSNELNLMFSKRKIISLGKLYGFVLIASKPKVVASEAVGQPVSQSLNLVSEAIAIFESDNNKYTMNKKMQSLLGVNELNNIDDYIFSEDLKQLEKRAKSEGDRSKILYRLNTLNTKTWVYESIRIQGDKTSKIIRETDFKNMIYNFRDQANLISDLKQLLLSSDNFALAIIQMEGFTPIKEKIGKDASMVLVSQFFGDLNNEIKDLVVYEIGYYKYAFIIKNIDVYNNILRDLHNNSSKLLKAKINFNDLSYEINNYLGFGERENISNITSENMVELVDATLKMATNPNYNKDYSIYFSKRKQVEVKNIDLSDDFLDNILK